MSKKVFFCKMKLFVWNEGIYSSDWLYLQSVCVYAKRPSFSQSLEMGHIVSIEKWFK